MQKILEAFANGNLRVNEKPMERGSGLDQAMKKVSELEDALAALLDDSGKELLEKLEDAQNDASGDDASDRFIDGFCLGALMMAEVYARRDSLIIGGREP